MIRLFTILLFILLLSSPSVAQIDFSQDELFDEIITSDKLIVINNRAIVCKKQKIMGAIDAFLMAEDLVQAEQLFASSMCYNINQITTVWKTNEDLLNNLLQFRILPPTTIKVGRDMEYWWVNIRYTVTYEDYLKLIREQILKYQKGLNEIHNKVKTREA